MSEDTGIHRVSGTNEGTRVVSLSSLDPNAKPLDAHAAFIAAYDRLSGLASIAPRPAVLVAAVDSRASVVEAVIVEAGHSLIIGRHSECGLRLMADTVALRQLVAHAEAQPSEAAPIIRLWDLNTGQPFLTEDGQPNAAVIAEGTLYVAVGVYALLFVPTQGPAAAPWSTHPEEAWKALPQREFIDRRTPDATRLGPSQRRRSDGQRYETDISRVLEARDRTSISRVEPLLSLGEDVAPKNAWGVLVLATDMMAAKHHLSWEHLDRGVLLGRYDRCGIRLADSDGISRVHLLLILSGEEVLAIDTASSNGTWRGPKKIETDTLRDPDLLRLGETVRMQWRRLLGSGAGGAS
ncbi:MAG TPA: FHA domain-containing protein [Hyalangium sp.]|nr:FHA domain-containing protein [Hyalangium sp.]